MTEEEYLSLARRLDEMLAAFVAAAPHEVQEQVGNLLSGIDMLHREGLERLAEGLRGAGAGEALDRVTAEDPVVTILLGLYDLAELPIPEEPEEGRSSPETTGKPAKAAGFVPLDSLRRGGG